MGASSLMGAVEAFHAVAAPLPLMLVLLALAVIFAVLVVYIVARDLR